MAIGGWSVSDNDEVDLVGLYSATGSRCGWCSDLFVIMSRSKAGVFSKLKILMADFIPAMRQMVFQI